MTIIVKGFVKPEFNEGQERLFDLFIEEHTTDDFAFEPYRIDKVVISTDDEILIYTSRFIQLDRQYESTTPVHHLQIMEVFRMYGADDPYCDQVGHNRYREVMLTSVYRTAEGDPGWVISSTEHAEDLSSLHTDWL